MCYILCKIGPMYYIFNEKHFELWKIKMEYLLVEKDQWIAVDPITTLKGMSTEY
jgi:hypothetical protein